MYDPEDGCLPANTVSWTLSGHGSLGTGDNIVLAGLSDGTYTLTLSASDSSAQAAEKSITFRIGAVGPAYLPIVLKQ